MQPRALRPSGSLLRAGFATSKPRCRAIPSGPRGTPRRPPPPPPPPRSKRPSRQPQSSPDPLKEPPKLIKGQVPSLDAVSSALRNADSNDLVSAVHIPNDPNGVLTPDHPATNILSNSAIVVTRQLELMNVMLGFEQANRYVIMDPQGNHIGYMAERDLGMGNMMARQMFSTHRSFTTHVFDKQGKEVLRFHRPFAWLSSRIGIYDPTEPRKHSYSSSTTLTDPNPGGLSTGMGAESTQVSPLALSDMRIIGEAQQQWAPLRRKYNLFLHRNAPPANQRPESQQNPPPSQPLSNSQALDLTPYNNEGEFAQFAYVDEPFLSWDFSLLSADSKLIGSVNRNFAGFGREIFTDTGVYALRMDAAGLAQEPGHLISQTGQSGQAVDEAPSTAMTLDQRAVMLATAISVDFDYFSRKSGSGGGMGFMPLWFPWGGGGAATGEASAEAGAVEGAGGAGGGVARAGAGEVGEGAAVGAGTMAGYEAMQRGGQRREDGAGGDAPLSPDRDPSLSGASGQPPQQQLGQVGQDEDVWGNDDDPWGGNSGGGSDGSNAGGDGGGGFDLGDFFDS